MKNSEKSKKLKLNKKTISKLDNEDLTSLKGGKPNTFTCEVPSHVGECLKCPWPRTW